jgi:beta-glucanase (GH16 family)
MRHLLALSALAAFIAGCSSGSDSPETDPFFPAPEEEWEMVWSDEFDGDSLNAANWDIQEGDGSEFGLDRWGNNEQQWYSADNITVADGLLTIEARSEELVEDFPYTSARIRTYEKFDFKYGRVEALVKSAEGQGLWSAFWLLSTNSPYNGWASSGEVDIMEVINANTDAEQVFGTLQLTSTPMEDVSPADDFNVYAVEWSENEIRWYVNDVQYKVVNKDAWYSYYYANQQTGYTAGAGSAPFDVDFHILLNLAVGGNLPGAVDDSAIPADMVVDYVRVYSCTVNPGTGTGCNSNADRTLESPDPQQAFEDSFDLYVDQAGPLEWTISGETVARELAVNSFWDNDGALTFSEVSADDPNRGIVIDVMTSNSGNISINAVDGEPTTLFGMGNNPNFWELHAGELKFDLYVDSSGTDPESSILIKMDSGWPAVGSVELKVADLAPDAWTTISVQVNDLLASRGEGLDPLDTGEIVSFFVLEPTGAAHVQVDNIEIACGHPVQNGCGILPPGGEVGGEIVNVFIDEVDPIWTNGFGAWDDVFLADYYDGATANHVTWSVVPSGDPEHDDVALVNFGTNGANGVWYVQSAGPVDLSAFSDNGKLIFDLKLEAGSTHGMTYKVDCFFPCSTGDQVLDVSGDVRGEWNTHEITVSSLISAGLDISSVNSAIVLFPTWGDQQGVSFEVDNIRYENPTTGGPGGPTESPDALIYDDALNSQWVLWDCCGQATVAEVDASDPARGKVAELSYGGTGETVSGFTFGDATGPQSADLSAYAGGTLEFDAMVVSAPTSGGDTWLLKVESENAAVFVEIPLSASEEGVAPVVGQWQHYTFPLDTTLGAIDLSTVQVVLVFPPWGTSAGGVIQLDNVGFVLPGGSGGGSSLTVFADQLEDVWELWDCCGNADVSVQDAGAPYGPIAELSFTGAGGTVSGFLYGDDPDASTSLDVSAFNKLEFDAKVVSQPSTGDDTWLMKIESANAANFVEVNLNTSEEGQSPATGEWQHYTFNLADLSGVDWTDLQIIMIFPPWMAAQGGLIQTDNVMFTE